MQKKEIRSTTGELYWNYGQGYVTANTPRTQAAVGFLADVPVKLADCEIRTVQPLRVDPGHVVGRPALGREQAHPHHGRRPRAKHRHGLQPRRPAPAGHRQVARAPGGRPRHGYARREPATATVTALSPYGYKTADVQAKPQAGSVVIPLDGRNKAAYYEVRWR